MKKTISLLTALAMAAMLCTFAAFAAAPTVEIRTPEALPRAGETFAVELHLSDCPDAATLQFTLSYNKMLMTCTDAAIGGALNGMISATNPAASVGAKIAAIAAENRPVNGTIAVFTFTAKQDIPTWEFGLPDSKIRCTDETSVDFTIQGGTDERIPSLTFPDVDRKSWAVPYIEEAVENGWFTGYADGNFGPDDVITRAQFVVILWRQSGSPAAAGENPFADVPDDSYYAEAVKWAKANGVVDGTSETTFSPDLPLTREQAVKILYAYAGGQSGMELMFAGIYDGHFTDSAEVSAWAKAPMYWALYHEVISGTSETTLSPSQEATRAQAAKILVNYAKNLQEKGE